MTKLEIDSTQRTIRLELELKGESNPIQVRVMRYHVSEEGGETFIELDELEASREWIGVVLNLTVKGRRFVVPKLLKLAL